jgi:hypothetical protein
MKLTIEIVDIMAKITHWLEKAGYRVDSFEARENGLRETYFEFRIVKENKA